MAARCLAPGTEATGSGSGRAAPALVQAAEAALASSVQRVVVIEHGGAHYVVKRADHRPRSLAQALLLRWVVKWLCGKALPMRTLRASNGMSSLDFEAQRLIALSKAGVAVPRVVHQASDYLILAHCGSSVASRLLGWPAEVWRNELPSLAAELAAFHRAGHWHGAAQIKNLTRLGGLNYRIDFEESFGEHVPLAAAQALDLVLFLNSISLRGPIDEHEARQLLPVLLDTYLALNPDAQVIALPARVLPWLDAPMGLAARLMRLQRWGRRRNGVARLAILVEVLKARLGPGFSVAGRQQT